MTHRQLWVQEEDTGLLEAVQRHGPRRWGFIASFVPGRTGKQCRERWYHHVDPDIIKGKWTNQEDVKILELVKAHGRRWAVIARCLKGRTDNSVKNRYESFLKHSGAAADDTEDSSSLSSFTDRADVDESAHSTASDDPEIEVREAAVRTRNPLTRRRFDGGSLHSEHEGSALPPSTFGKNKFVRRLGQPDSVANSPLLSHSSFLAKKRRSVWSDSDDEPEVAVPHSYLNPPLPENTDYLPVTPTPCPVAKRPKTYDLMELLWQAAVSLDEISPSRDAD